jgi:hypothetical protein
LEVSAIQNSHAVQIDAFLSQLEDSPRDECGLLIGVVKADQGRSDF